MWNIIIMNRFKLLFTIITLSFFIGCTSDSASTEQEATNSNKQVAEVVKEETVVDSSAIKKMEAEAAVAKAEAEAEKERLAKEAEDKRLAEEKRKRDEEKRKERERKRVAAKKAAAEKAAAEAANTSNVVTLPPPPPPPPAPTPKPVPQKTTGAKIEFVEMNHNFGTIKEGDLVKYEFEYTNVGTEDLVIKDAQVTCGCTAPGFSFFPLEPGLSSAVSVSFNSANKVGAQRPTITIITNGYPSRHVLTLEGTVVK